MTASKAASGKGMASAVHSMRSMGGGRASPFRGWARAWRDFYRYGSMWQRFTLRGAFNPLQWVGYWPLNLLQRQLAVAKILGGVPRHRTQTPATG